MKPIPPFLWKPWARNPQERGNQRVKGRVKEIHSACPLITDKDARKEGEEQEIVKLVGVGGGGGGGGGGWGGDRKSEPDT